MYAERMVLLKDLKFLLNTDQKSNFVDYQNNYIERSSIDAKSFNILATSSNILIIFIIQTKLSSDLYRAKF